MSFLGTAFSGATNNFNTANTGLQQGAQANLQSFAPQISTANTNYSQANAGLNSLAQMLQQQATGQGPNLANALLQQATGQNVANQAALAAGQRGASSNVGLMSRQAAQAGAQAQQQAASQGSINALQQQIAAQQALGGVYGTQGSLANQNLGIQQAGQQAQNSLITGAQGSNNQLGANIAAQNAATNQGLIGGVANMGAKLIGMADGGMPALSILPQWGQGSNFGFNFTSGKKAKDPMAGATNAVSDASGVEGGAQLAGDAGPMMAVAAQGGGVSDLPFMPIDFKRGGTVPGKPKVKGNNLKNDVVPAMLSPEEIVVPNSVTQSSDPVGNGAKFIAQVMAGKHRRGK